MPDASARTPVQMPGLPAVRERLGLGIGMDLTWSGRIGFQRDADGRDAITDRMERFFDRYRGVFEYLFFAFQPRDRCVLDATRYFAAYDDLFAHVPEMRHRAFHQTTLNMGAVEPYDRTDVLRFTNALVERYGFSWVVEDLGLWSVRGKPVPFPLPPFMTEAGLEACIRNVSEIRDGLDCRLCVEFPGFTEGVNFHIGHADAFEHFRILAETTGVAVTIDIGHILSYQWLTGNGGDRMLDGLERLPLDHCFEFHLSGCEITNGKFRDLHHGVLLDEQIALLEHLLPRCPNVRAVTYEDPQYTGEGILIPKSQRNFVRMRDIVTAWADA
jgi:uncharacterized protein (UPF0276 family)